MKNKKTITLLITLIAASGMLIPSAGAAVIDVDKGINKKIETQINDNINGETGKIGDKELSPLNLGNEKQGIDRDLEQLKAKLENLQEEKVPSFILRLESHSIPRGVRGEGIRIAGVIPFQ